VEFEEYVATRGRALERYAYVLAGDAHLAQDLTQTALVKAYRRWSWVARADSPDRYVRRILTTSFIDHTRKRSSTERPTGVVRDDVGGHDPAQVTVVRDQLRRGLTSLTGQQRAVLVLRIFEGYDDVAIADVLHCSPATVRSHASRGLDRLRAFLATDEGGVR
jgi:RNA polymerase sigma-70 factor (sigma-E family)